MYGKDEVQERKMSSKRFGLLVETAMSSWRIYYIPDGTSWSDLLMRCSNWLVDYGREGRQVSMGSVVAVVTIHLPACLHTALPHSLLQSLENRADNTTTASIDADIQCCCPHADICWHSCCFLLQGQLWISSADTTMSLLDCYDHDS